MARLNLDQVAEEHRTSMLIGLIGLFLLGIGVLSAVVISLNQSKPKVEIIPADAGRTSEDTEIVVDVTGAVEKPGVYRLPAGTRVNDALVAAGGLSLEADRDWISRFLNRAQVITDGIKIYIPHIDEKKEAGSTSVSQIEGEGAVIGVGVGTKININTATQQELDSLWGIGEKRASAIVNNRPYTNIIEIRTKAGIPSNVFERIKDEISIF